MIHHKGTKDTKLFFVFFILICVLCAFVVNSEAQVLFKDDFSGGKSKLWNQKNDGPKAGKFQPQGGAYRISSSDPAQAIPRALVSGAGQSNYYVQADVRINGSPAKFSSASLIAYYIDSNHYYEFSIDVNSRFWSLQKIDKSGFALLSRGPIPAARSTYRLGLYVRDGDLRAFLDNVMVTEQFDSRPLPGGAFGLSAQGAETLWDNVLVKASNPNDFFYTINSKATNQQGKVSFGDANLTVLIEGGQALSGIQVIRINRDAISYFVFIDPSNRARVRSGFLHEFDPLQGKDYRVRLQRSGNGFSPGSHSYTTLEADWILGFLHRSARYATKGVVADLNVIRNVYLRGQGLVQSGNILLNDSGFGPAGQKIEENGVLFGKWEEFGNYRLFPSQSGNLSSSRAALAAIESRLNVPNNSKFTVFSLSLSSGSATGVLSWFVQEDSRAILVTESADLPGKITPGNSYRVPFTILNSGEAAGSFRFSVVLSKNGFMGSTDTKLAQQSFSGIGPGARISSEVNAVVPASTPPGRYFIGTLLEIDNKKTKLVRLNNPSNPVRPITVGDFPANGRIQIELTWDGNADLDLHVTDPYGETIYYFHPVSQSGGAYQEDRECYNNNGQPERVTYNDGAAAAGNYQISIHYFRSCGEARDARWNLSVNADNRSSNYSGTIKPGEYIRAADFTR
ncbi:hypothetical protein L0152_15605 [bacterium]|nr:hypothetical protein [bacterium]